MFVLIIIIILYFCMLPLLCQFNYPPMKRPAIPHV
uniref:Uncharacterized protein n=1 Tax=Anguilla anguilla TaxID=7936 RepID=A0A0E9P7K0_ANGAN